MSKMKHLRLSHSVRSCAVRRQSQRLSTPTLEQNKCARKDISRYRGVSSM